MKIQLEDAGSVYIVWPLDGAAAKWLRDTNVGAVRRWGVEGSVVAIRWDHVIDFLDLAGSCRVEIVRANNEVSND